jgi:hypothetical protein
MYERDMEQEEATALGVKWYSNKKFTSVGTLYWANAPNKSHIYSTAEMEAFSTTKEDKHYENSMSRKISCTSSGLRTQWNAFWKSWLQTKPTPVHRIFMYQTRNTWPRIW